jgi:hypothetical protein
MLSRVLRRVTSSPYLRTERPGLDFTRYHYGNAPAPITGYWKVSHGYDFGSDQHDYEDHGMHVVHQRPLHLRGFWVALAGVTSLAFLYFTWMEGPYTGFFFGHYRLDVGLNAAKYVNDDEEYHDWDLVADKVHKMMAAEDEEEEAGEEEASEAEASEAEADEKEGEEEDKSESEASSSDSSSSEGTSESGSEDTESSEDEE